MPRLRSLSINTPPSDQSSSLPSSPAILARGFRSLRRAHRQRTSSVPSSPVPNSQPSPHAEATTNHLTLTQSVPISTSASTTSNSSSQQLSPASSHPPPHIRLVPNVGLANRCFVFEVIERDLEPGVVLRIGRYSDRSSMPNRLSFKSKVVSRSHAEIWVQPETNKIYVRDVGSSSGTFVNRARLSPANLQSAPQEVKDGDVIQLGVDYQGGIEPMYRAVRMRLEVNRDTHVSHLFNRAAFTQLRHHLLATVAPNLNTGSDTSDFSEEDENPKSSPHASSLPENVKVRETSTKTTARNSPSAPVQHAEIQECCICLYAIAPLQALFIAPCSHIFHFKCLRPLLFQNYPGFCCPICRTYNDLEASVALEVSDVMESLGIKTSEDEEEEKVEGRQEAAPATAASGAAGPGAGAEAEAAPAGIAKRGEPQQPAIREEEEPSSHPASRRASRHLPLPNTTENLLSTTLVASPPTFEEMMTASSGSPT